MNELNLVTQRGLLEQQLEQLKVRLSSVQKDLQKPYQQDFSEQATERENDDVLEEIARETSLSITSIEHALKRIESGQYGACENCDEDISAQRLNILPETTLCVNCAD